MISSHASRRMIEGVVQVIRNEALIFHNFLGDLMSHYLTQPEEIDYILMNEEQDVEMPFTVQSNLNPLSNSQLAGTTQRSMPVNH